MTFCDVITKEQCNGSDKSPFAAISLLFINNGRFFSLFRTVRKDMMHCQLDVEYVAKLVCIRRGFDYVLSRDDQIIWMTQTGRSLASAILTCLGYSTAEFDEAFK